MVRISSTRPPRQREDRELALGYQSRPPWCAIVRRGIGLCVQAIWVKRRKSEARSREISTRASIRIVSVAGPERENRGRNENRIVVWEQRRVFLEGTKKEEGERERKNRGETIMEKGRRERGVSLVRKLERQTCRYENFNRLC